MKAIRDKTNKGISLVEVLMGVAVLMIILVSAYQAYIATFKSIQTSRVKIAQNDLANEQIEIIRNLPFSDVGTVGGIPPGKIPPLQTIVRDGISFTVRTTILPKDDPFDGLFPVDTSPTDWKLAEVEVSCFACADQTPLRFDTRIGPKNLETSSNNGALFIKVLDASGKVVQGANVHVQNSSSTPQINADYVTDANGLLALVDVPAGILTYQITVTKPGYSTDKTYPPGDPVNPNPLKPHATVIMGQVTQISFIIDLLSALTISSVTNTCTSIGNIQFSLKGGQPIGQNPAVLSYNQNDATNASGLKPLASLQWGSYVLTAIDSGYDLAGSIPFIPISLAPNATQSLKLILQPKNSSALLVTVKDSSSGLALSNADVSLTGPGYSNILTTGQGFLRQTDWSGGAGQSDFIDPTKFFDSDGNIDIANPAGQIKLKNTFGTYASSGVLISSSFDTGSPSNFYHILWNPPDQPAQTGPDSVRFQIATNNDDATWNFLGPDGTALTYYTLANKNINAIHNGKRYLRYRVFLQTANTNFTPNLANISFTFSSACVPPGQVFFNGLAQQSYTITVSETGYQTYSDSNVVVSSPWQSINISLTPS